MSEAFQFFDSQNARGKELYPHDLLKAFHLREMDDVSEAETGKIVNEWEQIPQSRLREFFGNYLYRVKIWVSGSRAKVLSAHNIQMFKGVTRNSRLPYAQFYKGAYCYADMVNSSSMPFVSGIRNVYAFIWAYSLRAQYTNLGWLSAQNYIMGEDETANSFNMYKLIVSHDTPASLLSALADRLRPLRLSKLKHRKGKDGFESQGKERPADGICGSYLHFFSEYGFLMQ